MDYSCGTCEYYGKISRNICQRTLSYVTINDSCNYWKVHSNITRMVEEGIKRKERESKERILKFERENTIKAAEQGDAVAQYELGLLYIDGKKGLPTEPDKAFEWFNKAAEQGNAAALCALGILYKNGQGVTKDFVKAVELFDKAAEQGNADAQCLLGYMYEDGQGVGKDSGKAAELFTKAAAQGHEEAKLKIAAENLLKKAEQGDINAQYELGLLYENGKGVSKDSVKAAEWFGKAAEQGNASAQYELGLLYESGQGVSKDSNKAAELFAKAAAQGNGDAKNAIARRKSAKKEKIADTLRIIFRILAPVLAAVSIVLFLSFSYYNRTFQGIFIILLAQIPFLVIYFSGEDRTALRVTFLVINIISNLFITGYFETIVYVLGLAPCIIGMIYHRED